MVLSSLYERIFLNNLNFPPLNKMKEIEKRLKNSILIKSDKLEIINLGNNLLEELELKKKELNNENSKYIFYLNFKKSQYLIDFYLLNLKKHKDINPFLLKVNKNLVPNYFDIIKLPIDISKIFKDFSINFKEKNILKSSLKSSEFKEFVSNSFNSLFESNLILSNITNWLNQIRSNNKLLNSINLKFDPWINCINPSWNLCITSFKILLNQMCENYLTFNPPNSDIKLMGDNIINYIYKLFNLFELNIFQEIKLISQKGIKRLKLENNLLIKNIEYFESSIFKNLYDIPTNHINKIEIKKSNKSDILCYKFKPIITNHKNTKSDILLRQRVLKSFILKELIRKGFKFISLNSLNNIIDVLDYLILKEFKKSSVLKSYFI